MGWGLALGAIRTTYCSLARKERDELLFFWSLAWPSLPRASPHRPLSPPHFFNLPTPPEPASAPGPGGPPCAVSGSHLLLRGCAVSGVPHADQHWGRAWVSVLLGMDGAEAVAAAGPAAVGLGDLPELCADEVLLRLDLPAGSRGSTTRSAARQERTSYGRPSCRRTVWVRRQAT